MSPLTEPTKLVLQKTYVGVDDPDAAAYITLVEAADTAAGSPGGLETATKVAIHSFVKGCKADGIWPAIKASCILAGARTRQGALIPLANASGVVPTFNGTAGGWNYNRKTGLAGNGTDNYINSGRNNNADPQNSQHLSVFVSTANTNSIAVLIGTTGADGASQVVTDTTAAPGQTFFRSRSTASPLVFTATGLNNQTGFHGLSRLGPSSGNVRVSSTTTAFSYASVTPVNATIGVFNNGSTSAYTNARLAFYSIGEALPDGPVKTGLQMLDERVSALITAIGVAF